MDHLFTGEETWRGGFYELALDFGPEPRDALLSTALLAIWETPRLQGCYLRPDIDPSRQARVAPTLAIQEAHGHLRGIATLPNGEQVACGSFLVREEQGSVWLTFYLPLGALATAYPVNGYPFDNSPSSRMWREPLESWLADIGRTTFARAPFPLGLIGMEVSGEVASQEVSATGIPTKRYIGYLYPETNGLSCYPTNQWHKPSLPPVAKANDGERGEQTEVRHAPGPH
jgi:hypothetical protein